MTDLPIAGEGQAPHSLTPAGAFAAFGSSPRGLGAGEAAARLVRFGPNRLPAPARRGSVRRFLSQFGNVLVQVLIMAAAVTAVLGHWVDTGVILAVVIANAGIGFLQEGRAEAAIAAIRDMLAPQATVLRDGRRTTVEAASLVPGDVVLLEPGDKVPADLRLVALHGLTLQEAILTGESVPVAKQLAAVATEAALGDRHSMAYSGTLVTRGTGRGLVTATGASTEIGRIGGLLAGVEDLATPLVAQMDRFARWLSFLILAASALLLAWGVFLAHHAFADLFMAVVALAVAAIPEGLPAVMTITLAIGVQAMARRNAIVRRLPAIEAIGAVSVICTDKTGTLTRNEMVVTEAETRAGRFAVEGEGYAPLGRITPAEGLASLGLAAALCNDARLRQSAEGEGGAAIWRVEGDPMEGALLAFAAKTEGATTEGWHRLAELPFDARHRYMAVLSAGPGGIRRLDVKGAPEAVLGMCSDIAPTDWLARADAMAARGLRVLALAFAPLPAPGAVTEAEAAPHPAIDHGLLDGGLHFLGLVGLIDPPRPEAAAAVAECRSAGIGVKIITGDHAGTALAIAGAVGLARPDRVLTGAEIEEMDDLRLALAVAETDVFARTSPEHKLRLVRALQADGLSVAMTGDGINDAPALKRADVGVAMGRKGSDAAREAADLVLADDNFATIAAAVREGRTVFDNLRKVIAFELPTSTGEAGVLVLALLAGFALPVTAVQILWINLVTGVTLGLALAFEPTETGTMARPPRPRDAPILTLELVWHVILVSALFIAAAFAVFAYALDRGHSLALAQTMAMNMLAVLETFHLFFVRNIHGTSLTWSAMRGTRVVWATVIAIVLAQCAVTYLPPLQAVLGTEAVPLRDGLVILGLGAAFFALLEIEKQLRLGLRRGAGP
jgi:magnesium-transporting ATPase (P-type)